VSLDILASACRSRVRIILVTDSHLAQTAAPCNDNWRAARDFVRRAGADLTVHLGDITLDAIDDPAHDACALALSADWPTPLRFLPGNHDIGDNPPGPGVPAEQPLDLERLAAYRHRFGADYWGLDAAGWRLIGLDAQLFDSGSEAEAEQWRWLGAEFAQLGRRRVVLLLHKPLYLDDPADPTPHIRYVPAGPRRRLIEMLRPIDLRLVVSGHTHQYFDRTLGGVRHIWLPSTAFVIPDTIQDRLGEKVTGLGVLELMEDGYRFDLVCPEGMVRHSLVDCPFYAAMAAHAAPVGAAASDRSPPR
jgi:3',5'-cyclic AMP phosphodiesterase CpdA